MEETRFQKLIRERYDHGQEMSYAEEGTFLCLLNGPNAYQNEDKMLEYAEANPDISMEDLVDYWYSITPEGLPPGMDPDELLRDDDDEEDES